MAKEDFCFTYYDGDAARDMSHMTRLQRGAYGDIISAIRKFGHISLDQARMILSRDFDECWPAIQLVLKSDGAGKFYIEWLENSLNAMRRSSAKQRERRNSFLAKNQNNSTAVEPRLNHGSPPVQPIIKMEMEMEMKKDFELKGGMGENKDFVDFEILTEEILKGNDPQWEVLLMSDRDGAISYDADGVRGHEAKCIRDKSEFRTAQHFRKSLYAYLKTIYKRKSENQQNGNFNRKTAGKNQLTVAGAADFLRGLSDTPPGTAAGS
jgi:hypothetical protein